MNTHPINVVFTENNSHIRTYKLPFAVYRDQAVTHTGQWLLSELTLIDEVLVEAYGSNTLKISIASCESTSSTSAHIFREIDGLMASACQRAKEHQAAVADIMNLP